MRFSNLFCPTLREVPREAEVVSHQLMLRAGLIQKVAAGIYSFLPLGYRILRKFETIVREEMDNIGGQEVYLPMVVPAELWKQSTRWDKYGPELLRLKDRHDNDFCLGPTHEEVITEMVKGRLTSYKQLPVMLYQIQSKFRDERRPRFGIMRGREFGMKDAYSFHESQDDLNTTYDKVAEAYKRIFERCGLESRMVAADSGSIGGSVSAEFMITATTGEDVILDCAKCGYAANIEAAKVVVDGDDQIPSSSQGISKVETPNIKSIKELSEFFNIKPRQCIKTLLVIADKEPVLVLVRGDYELNEIKLKNYLKVDDMVLATDVEVHQHMNCPRGFLGPINLNKTCRIVADANVKAISDGYIGANEKDYHYKGVVVQRDVKIDEYTDLREAMEGDICPQCQKGALSYCRGIEVGHIFQLGDDYSKKMQATYLNQQGKSTPFLMGCYGVGIGRTVAAAIEQYHDEKGISWPVSLAPYHVDIIVTSMKETSLVEKANELYQRLSEKGVEVILDDRAVSAGVKFKDADLIGFPLQMVIGKQYTADKKIEINVRASGEKMSVAEDDLDAVLQRYLT